MTDEQIEALWLATFDQPLPLPDRSMMRAVLRRRLFARALLASASIPADVRDAERYRWLRSVEAWDHWDRLGHYGEDELDRQIDKARALGTPASGVPVEMNAEPSAHPITPSSPPSSVETSNTAAPPALQGSEKL